MPITLTPEQEAWIQAHISTGDFATLEQAARQLIDESIASRRHLKTGEISSTRQALWAGELSDADLKAIGAAEMDARHNHLDSELS